MQLRMSFILLFVLVDTIYKFLDRWYFPRCFGPKDRKRNAIKNELYSIICFSRYNL